LGSDVAFFLYGGTALIEGRGERVTPLPSLPPIWVILVVPEIPRPQGKTKKLYSSLNSSHYSDGQITQKLVVALKEKQEFTPLIFNTFEEVAFAQFPGLNVYWEHLREAGADNIHLAGSGPTLFTLLKNKARAEELYHRLQQKGLQTYLTHPLASIDEIE
jgi:4-diphosphocytidyl-2-C-methyl-D-erythritol kinase